MAAVRMAAAVLQRETLYCRTGLIMGLSDCGYSNIMIIVITIIDYITIMPFEQDLHIHHSSHKVSYTQCLCIHSPDYCIHIPAKYIHENP